jgi:hypothetical protein
LFSFGFPPIWQFPWEYYIYIECGLSRRVAGHWGVQPR